MVVVLRPLTVSRYVVVFVGDTWKQLMIPRRSVPIPLTEPVVSGSVPAHNVAVLP